jgi:MarC family membrane protein
LEYTFLSATILLILITDPIGNIPIFANALRHVPPKRRPIVILREVMIASVVLFSFLFAGQSMIRFMGLSELSLLIAGGVILFLIAIRMVFPPPASDLPEQTQEPLIVPLAIPLIAGPSAMATVMLLASQAPHRQLEWAGALCVTMMVSAVVLVLADRIQRLAGERVVTAFERLMGLILVALSIEMILRGVTMFIKQLA